MKYKIIMASLVLLFALTVTPVYGEEEGDVYYCADDQSNGFYFDEKQGSYKKTGFDVKKFKVKIDRANNRVELAGSAVLSDIYQCATFYTKIASLACSKNFHMFNLNTETGRYVLAAGYGYVNGDSDTVSISLGTCDKF